jgi:hypothetical protein
MAQPTHEPAYYDICKVEDSPRYSSLIHDVSHKDKKGSGE